MLQELVDFLIEVRPRGGLVVVLLPNFLAFVFCKDLRPGSRGDRCSRCHQRWFMTRFGRTDAGLGTRSGRTGAGPLFTRSGRTGADEREQR